MDAIENLLTRRSIRKFTGTPVNNDLIDKMLQAAMYAPSARNTRAWDFVVITKRELLDRLSVIHPYARMLKMAPLAILVCGDKKLEPNEAYLSINCSAATQNILLAAHALGLGSVWLGVYSRTERMDPIRDLLKLPAENMPVSLIAIGWPDEKIPHPERYSKEKIHYNDSW
ncbi:MAG TPA: nitroreductase family protein [Bacteroidales bacterium]|nr:nitroreductase family protein [Bacteroidales bacterium]HOH84236.1 nitroreductase family protein [Bacteroidales bacterium]